MIPSLRRVATLAAAALVIAASPAGGAVIKIADGPITNLAADGTNVAFVTNVYSKSCTSPGGDRRQVVYVNARTRKSVLLTTETGCDTLSGPGFGVDTDRWLAITRNHVYWIDTTISPGHFYSDLAVATPGSKPIRRDQGDLGDRQPGALIAWAGRSYRLTGILKEPRTCGVPPLAPTGCDTVPALGSRDASAGEQETALATTATPVALEAVSEQGALLLGDGGSLSITTASASTPLVGSAVDEAAIDGPTIVGVAGDHSKIRLGFWNASGKKVGSCTARKIGTRDRGVAVAGKTVAFATTRGIYVARVRVGAHSACRAAKLVDLTNGRRLAGFALTATGGLIYATNPRPDTARGTVSRLTPKQLAAAGFRLR